MDQLKRLKPGKVYFILLFADDGLKVPHIQTLIFQRSGVLADGTPAHFFDLVTDEDSRSFFVREQDAEDLLLEPAELLQRLKDVFSRAA